MNYDQVATQWLAEQRRQQAKRTLHSKGFIGARGYTHLDAPIHLSNPAAIGSLVAAFSSADKLRDWHFLPFLTNYDRTRKYRHASSVTADDTNQKHRTHLKSRPILSASHADACIYSFMSYCLEKPYETYLGDKGLKDIVIAYRSVDGKNNIDFAMRVFLHMEKHDEVTGIFLDIKSFFDTIPHASLDTAICRVLKLSDLPSELRYIFSNLTEYRYLNTDAALAELKKQGVPYSQKVPNGRSKILCSLTNYNKFLENKQFVKKNMTGRGIPQGSPVSGILANIALSEFDEYAKKRISRYKSGLYQRYSDDIAFVVPTTHAKSAHTDIVNYLLSLGYKISKAKTEAFAITDMTITNVTKDYEASAKNKRQNAQYLGLEWNGISITLRPGTINKRFRVYYKLHKKFWRYSKLAAKKTGSTRLARQQHRIRHTIKSKS